MTAHLAALVVIFGQLSVLAVGGVAPVLPEMQRQVVGVRGWLTPAQFAGLFALAQAAPGPNMLISTLIGWRVAGLPGALVATGSLIGPSSLLAYATARLWHRARGATWRSIVQAGLTPVTVGLVAAAAWMLATATATDAVAAGITAATALLLVTTRIHPLLLLAAGAAIGAAGLV
ncbi:MAG TPA: chromate transporter [Acetobacteraceae bacterium]|nr:chromate transporter [Acetobacteraceae bacterium]